MEQGGRPRDDAISIDDGRESRASEVRGRGWYRCGMLAELLDGVAAGCNRRSVASSSASSVALLSNSTLRPICVKCNWLTLSVSAVGMFSIGVLGARLLGERARTRALARNVEAKGAARMCLPNLAGDVAPDGPQASRTNLLKLSEAVPAVAEILALVAMLSTSS